MMQMVDTHCHLNFDSYDSDRESILDEASRVGVTKVIIPAVDIQTTREAVALAQDYTGVFAAVGIHPNSTDDFNHDKLSEIEKASHHHKVIAIGEIGLDYYWDKSPKESQFKAFEAQLQLACQRELPVIIHNRDAHDDVIRFLEEWVLTLPASLKDRPGVLHSFSAPMAIAEKALALGFYLGFTGPITFKKADELRQIAAIVPLDRLLVETDGPFLTPEPFRGKRNQPAYIPYIVDRLAGIKGVTNLEMARTTTENATRLFRI